MATTINAGRVRFVSRGTYNNSTQYYLFDLVDYNGSSYIAKENTLGNLPTNTQYWQLIAEKGNTGSTGQTGPVGPTGNGIASITKTATVGLVDTYTITYTNGNTTTFTITNGEDGEVTETELNVLREKVANQQKVIDQLPQVEGQGTSITLENTIEAPFTKFDVEGNSTQDGTPSPDNEVPIYSAGDNENLFDKETITFNAYDNIETAKDGLVTTKELSNTGTSNVNIRFPALNLSPDTYYISMDIRIKSGTGNFVKLNDGATDWSVVSKPTISSSFQRYVYKHTYTAEKALNQILVQFSNNSNTIYEIEKIMVSNKASGYSPYGMGSINEKISNENIFDGIMEQGAYSGSDGTTLINSPKYIRSKNYTNVVAGETYIITIKAKGTNQTNGNIFIYNIDGTLNSTINGLVNSFTIPTGGRKIRINVFNNNNIAPSDVEFAMMNIGSTATPYVEHKEQDYSIFVQQPFRSTKDKTIKDKFVIKSDNKKYERHWIGEVVLNGTEEVYLYNDNGSRAVFYINVADLYDYTNSAETPELLSNRFRPVSQTATWEPGGIACRIGGRTIFFIFKTGTSVNEFKNWLSTHNVVVQYLLAEPLDLPCTETQIQQLENKPSTYKDFTIIQSEDETPAYLEVSGIYDLNKLINN